MITRICLGLALLMARPLWPQVVSPIQNAPERTGGDEMAIPPPVDNDPTPTAVGVEARSNYLRGGLIFSTSYLDNLYAGEGGSVLSEEIFSVLPTISADQTTPRRHLAFTYRPGFTFFQPTSSLNEVDQNADVDFKYRLTPHGALSLHDTFQKSSTTYSLSDSGAGGGLLGVPQPVAAGVLAPFSERLTNSANGQFSLQLSPEAMIGVAGNSMKLHYPNSAETTGLYDFDQRGGSGFYNRRISESQYIGVNYAYSLVFAYPQNGQSETETHNFYAFYSIYPKRDFSISVSAGPQYYSVMQSAQPKSGAWEPEVMASVRWQRAHGYLGANFSRQVNAGGGLLGAFVSTIANGSGKWQVSRSWTLGASGAYAINKSVTPYLLAAAQNGDSVTGFATAEHTLNERFSLEFEYDRIHQSYEGIAAIASNPNSDRELISLVWQFMRPLGR